MEPRRLRVAAKQSATGRRVQLLRACSKLGWGSRTQAMTWIRQGGVRVDGRVVTDPLTWVDLDRQHITRAGVESSGVASSDVSPRLGALMQPRSPKGRLVL